MRKRKTAAVSLARRAAKAAGRDRLRPDYLDATPERLRQARVEGDAPIDPNGVRRIVEPFDLLRARGLLDRGDAALNEALWLAGDRLRRHLHLAGLDGLSALDLTRPQVDGGEGGGPHAPGEAALRHREAFERAAAAVGIRLMPYVVAVVIEGKPVASLRGLIGETSHARTAEALALDRLRESLHRLCDFWGMRTRSRTHPVVAWRDEAASSS